MPSARLAKALVEKRGLEKEEERFEEENGEAWGRLETRVVAPLLEMYEREEMARFFGGIYGLDPVQIAAKMNLLAQAVFDKMTEGKKTFVVTFSS